MTPSFFTRFDSECMASAIRLARRGLYTTDPNPRVGCVIAKDGQVIGSGWHEKAGQPHAEIMALRSVQDSVQGSTVYVTLEPCSHVGKTPPCAEALIEAKVAKVVAAMGDPNPMVAGKGFRALQEAGISVEVGLQEAEAKALNPGFVKRMAQNLPYVRVKLAMSLDGRTAMSSGESKWITGAAARSDVQRLRARSSVIITGSGTVKSDDPGLDVRQHELGFDDVELNNIRQPARVVLDSGATLPGASKVFKSTSDVYWAVSEKSKVSVSEDHNVHLLPLPVAKNGKLNLTSLLDELAAREMNEVLVEAGPTLAGEFVHQGLCDELLVYIAPKLLGSDARPLVDIPLLKMEQAVPLNLKDMRQFGEDIRLTYSV